MKDVPWCRRSSRKMSVNVLISGGGKGHVRSIAECFAFARLGDEPGMYIKAKAIDQATPTLLEALRQPGGVQGRPSRLFGRSR